MASSSSSLLVMVGRYNVDARHEHRAGTQKDTHYAKLAFAEIHLFP